MEGGNRSAAAVDSQYQQLRRSTQLIVDFRRNSSGQGVWWDLDKRARQEWAERRAFNNWIHLPEALFNEAFEVFALTKCLEPDQTIVMTLGHLGLQRQVVQQVCVCVCVCV